MTMKKQNFVFLSNFFSEVTKILVQVLASSDVEEEIETKRRRKQEKRRRSKVGK